MAENTSRILPNSRHNVYASSFPLPISSMTSSHFIHHLCNDEDLVPNSNEFDKHLKEEPHLNGTHSVGNTHHFIAPSTSFQAPDFPSSDGNLKMEEDIVQLEDMNPHSKYQTEYPASVRNRTSLTDSKIDLDSKSTCLTDEDTMDEKLDPLPLPPSCPSTNRHRTKLHSIQDILSNDPGDPMDLEEDICSPERTFYDPNFDPVSHYPPSTHEAEDLLIAAHALNGLKSGFIQESYDVKDPSKLSSLANEEISPNDRFISRVASIPIVNSGIRSLSHFYEQTKAHSQVVQYSAEVLEKNLKPISEMAGKYLSVPMREVDSFACRQLDRLESCYPSFRSADTIAPMLHDHPSPASPSVGSWQETSISVVPDSPSSSFYAASTSSKKSSFTTDDTLSSEPQPPTYEPHTSSYKSKWQQVTAGAVAAAGAGAAVVSEESMKNLRYCLEWLQFASQEIEQQIQKLRHITLSSVYPMTHSMGLIHQRDWLPDLNTIRKSIAETLRKVVDVVGRYASAFLNNDARNNVRSFILSLPARWASLNADPADSEKGEAQRVMAFASDTASILSSMQDIFSQALATAEQWLGTLQSVPFVNSIVHPALRAYNKSFASSSPLSAQSPPPPLPATTSLMTPSPSQFSSSSTSPSMFPMITSPMLSNDMSCMSIQTPVDGSHMHMRKRQCHLSPPPTPAEYLEPSLSLDPNAVASSSSSFPAKPLQRESKNAMKRRKRQELDITHERCTARFPWGDVSADQAVVSESAREE